VLGSYSRVRAYGEIFHPSACFSFREAIPALGKRLGTALPNDVRDPATIEAVRANPGAALDSLRDVVGDGVTISFSLFSFHLKKRSAYVLKRPDVALAIIRRRPIDSYASDLKAQHEESWSHVDTTGIRVIGNIREFTRYLHRQRRWYARSVKIAAKRGIDLPVFTYETDIAAGEAATRARIETCLPVAGIDPGTSTGAIQSMTRQDLTSEPGLKFENWETFAAQLSERGLSERAFEYLA
jgi:hypothetical protein